MDDIGTSNGTTFVITVSDANPHFYYMVRDLYLSDCAILSGWTSSYSIPSTDDVFFALNPVVYCLTLSNNRLGLLPSMHTKRTSVQHQINQSLSAIFLKTDTLF